MSKTCHLAEPARAWVDAQVAAGVAPDVEAYLSELVARDREGAERRVALHASLEAGDANAYVEMSIEYAFGEIRRRHRDAAPRCGQPGGDDIDKNI